MPITRRQWICNTAGLCVAPLIGSRVMAQQNWPSKPIRLVAPAPPGGATDTTARIISGHLSETLGQTVIVTNRPGGGTTIANKMVADSAPDGYTFGIVFPSIIQLPHLYETLTYDYQRDLAPVSIMVSLYNLFIVSSKLGVNTLEEFVALAKSRPGELNYCSFGTGTTPHLFGELLKMRAGLDMVHVPYTGAGPMMLSILAGDTHCGFVDIVTAAGQLDSENIKVLAVVNTERIPRLPNVPTFAEAGYPAINLSSWLGVMAPAGTPQEIINRFSAAIRSAVFSPEVMERMRASNMAPVGGSPADLQALLVRDSPVWAEIAKTANIKLD